MAAPATVTLFSESRLPGSDGSYTDQKIFAVSRGGQPALVKVAHDLGRIPDWVRVERLATLDPDTGVPIVAQAYALPLIKDSLGPTGRFEWQHQASPGNVVDLTKELFFAAAGDQNLEGLLMVEFGITHSQSK